MREGRQISLLFIDIDYFKQFNDLYGHLAGDDCLRKIATVLQTTARRGNDMAARYGGEEFACVLPGTGKKNALLLARKIIARTAALNIPHEGSSVAPYVTVSIGVATLVPARGHHYSHLIDAADRSLYSAKQQGRNRVVVLSDDVPDPLHALLAR
jgi:two-component system chemotaxis family response regulator WspR